MASFLIFSRLAEEKNLDRPYPFSKKMRSLQIYASIDGDKTLFRPILSVITLVIKSVFSYD